MSEMDFPLTTDNFKKGFLLSQEWIAGISEDHENIGFFNAFILHQETGEFVASHSFETFHKATEALKSIRTDWNFESLSDCGGAGACGGGGCGAGAGSCHTTEGSHAGHDHT